MSGVAATLAGSLTVAVVLLVAGAARRPACRRLPDPVSGPVRAPRRRRRQRLILALLAVVATMTAITLGPGPVVVMGGGGAVFVTRRRRSDAARQRREVDAAMADAVELFVVCVHAGRSPTQAVTDVAARAPPVLREAFGLVELQLHRGRSLAEALGELRRAAGPIGAELAAAVTAADRDGLPLTPVLDRLAAEARAARRRSGEAAARQLPVRMTFPLVVCTLPSFVLLAIAPAVLGALSTLRAGSP